MPNKPKIISKRKEITYRNYTENEIESAAALVTNSKMSIYQAAKTSGIPWSSLKRYLKNKEENDVYHLPKLGRQFVLPVELEQKLLKYILEMQELGFGLTVSHVQKIAFNLARSIGKEHLFSENMKSATKWWWKSYKNRYGLSLRVPENLSSYRASMGNPVMIDDYFSKLNQLLTTLGIKNYPERIWNVDETGLSYVVKPNRVIAAIGKRYVYNRSYGEKGETHTVIGCVCADGSWVPPFIIFKGVRWNDDLKKDCLPNVQVKLSAKGWVNSELFYEWFTFFLESIPPARPVVLLMDSHCSHVTPAVIDLAKANSIYIITFPAHCSHILQPLDVGVYKSLKAHWSKSLNTYMRDHPFDRPNRSNFHQIFNTPFISSFSGTNIKNAFRKAGVVPLDRNAISQEALAPSKLTDKSVATSSLTVQPEESHTTSRSSPTRPIEEILRLPSSSDKTTPSPKCHRRDSTAKVLTPSQQTDIVAKRGRPMKAKPSDPEKPSTSGICDNLVNNAIGLSATHQNKPCDEDWMCGVCGILYSRDVEKKSGAKWVQCCFCLMPYHTKCQQQSTEEDPYMCDKCSSVSY